MTDNILVEGNKIDIKLYSQLNSGISRKDMLEFTSMIYEVNDDSLLIAMPMQRSKMILFPVGEKIDMLFYCAHKSMYGCLGEVTKRLRQEGLYMLEVKLISDLKKVQRREHFRLSLAVPIQFYIWSFYISFYFIPITIIHINFYNCFLII